MAGPMTQAPKFLALSAAAARLGIHPKTLRRWADEGKMPCTLTLGGHRRFATDDLDNYDRARRKLRRVGGLEQRWAEHALVDTRQELITKTSDPDWLGHFGELDRNQFRTLGRRLLGLTMQYLSSQRGGASLLKEARDIGKTYAENSLDALIPLSQTLRILMFFRDTMMLSAFETPGATQLQPEANARMFRRMTEVFNTVQLAVADRYQREAEQTKNS